MSIYITGELNGDIYRLNPKITGIDFAKDDLVIILGNFSIPWIHPNYSPEDRAKLAFLDSLGFQIAFVDGNHENFSFLNSLAPTTWNKGKVHRIGKNIYHMMRGEIFEIDGLSFYVFGGAESTDRNDRKEGLTWWPQEQPTIEEFEYGLSNLEKYNNSINVVLSYRIPETRKNETDNACIALDHYRGIIDFDAWYYSGEKIDKNYPELKLYCLNNSFVKLN